MVSIRERERETTNSDTSGDTPLQIHVSEIALRGLQICWLIFVVSIGEREIERALIAIQVEPHSTSMTCLKCRGGLQIGTGMVRFRFQGKETKLNRLYKT